VIDPEAIDAAINTMHESKRRVSAQYTNRASQGGITCTRRLLWTRTNWERAQLPDLGLQRRFSLGNIFENVVVDWLAQAGITLVQRQRDLNWPAYELTGHIDGVLQMGDEQAILECKSCSPFVFAKVLKCRDASDVLALGTDYLMGYVTQSGSYSFLLGIRYCVLLFIDKSSGQTHSVLIDGLDPRVLERVEAHLKRLERVNRAVKQGADIDAEPGDYCTRCPFLAACAPKMAFAPGLYIVADETLEEAVAARQANAEAAKLFEDADAIVKKAITTPGERIVGDWLIKAKESTRTVYDVPEEVKKPYAKKVPQIRREYVPLGVKTEVVRAEEGVQAA